MNGLLIAGDVYINRFTDAGVPTGWVGPINTTKLALKTPSESKDRLSKQKEGYGQLLSNVNLAQATELTIVWDDQPAELVAMALLADVEDINQGSGNESLVAITLPADNKWAKLTFGNVATAGLDLYESDGVTPIAAAAYEINYALGMIRSAPGGALDTGSTTDVKLSYSYNAITGKRIKGGIRPIIRAGLMVDGKNLDNGLPVKLDVPEAVLAPTEEVDLFASDFVSTTLAGKVKLVEGETAPFYIDQEESA